jgi:hypothetical protein
MIWRYEDRFGYPSWCDVEIHERPDGKRVFLLTEISYNPARAVTQNPEILANRLKVRYRLNAHTLIWIEHYPERRQLTETGEWLREVYDLVKFKNGSTGRLRVVQVKRITPDQARALISGALKLVNAAPTWAPTPVR